MLHVSFSPPRLLGIRLAKEAAQAEEERARKLEAEAAAAAAAEADRRLNAEIEAMAEEDRRSREVEGERRAAEAVVREREEYLRDLYTSFDPLWGAVAWENDAAASKGIVEDGAVVPVEGDGVEGENGNKPTAWWRGADAPHIWAGPKTPRLRAPRLSPGSRFVPHAQAVLDGLEPQAVSVGRLSREYLVLLGLPHESVQDMYDKASSALYVLPAIRGLLFCTVWTELYFRVCCYWCLCIELHSGYGGM